MNEEKGTRRRDESYEELLAQSKKYAEVDEADDQAGGVAARPCPLCGADLEDQGDTYRCQQCGWNRRHPGWKKSKSEAEKGET